MTSKILIRKSPVYSNCPSCNLSNVLRRSSSRTTAERFINHLTFYKTFRCKSCGWRGYLSTFTITARSIWTFFYYIAIGIASAFIVWQVLKLTT